MREHLYQGKRIDNGKWIQGDLLTNGIDYETAIRINDKTSSEYGQIIKVNPETVSEFTGQYDKNLRRVFEGNIVRYYTGTNRASNKDIHLVVFEQRGGSAYYGITIDPIETWQFCLEVPAKLMEVIGNKWDNPELLEGNS